VSVFERIAEQARARVPLAHLPVPPRETLRPTWQDARVRRIARALADAGSRDPGGWYVAAPSGGVPRGRSVARTIAGREIVLFRDADGALRAGPGACPHLGALLDGCEVRGGEVHCPWHGMALGRDGRHGWHDLPAHDDGVLAWVRLGGPGESAAPAPTLVARPPLAESVSAVVVREAVCEPEDVIANRLDPWHGAWFHPYAFSHLAVDEAASSDDRLVVDVAFRLGRTWGVPVRAEFVTPDRRTIVMRILRGEGAGSVVETHATPIGPGPDGRARTLIVEATVAHSARRGFAVARALGPLLRPAMAHTAGRLWVDDLVYAERRYELRRRASAPAEDGR